MPDSASNAPFDARPRGGLVPPGATPHPARTNAVGDFGETELIDRSSANRHETLPLPPGATPTPGGITPAPEHLSPAPGPGGATQRMSPADSRPVLGPESDADDGPRRDGLPRSIGRYKVHSELGRGGMGVVVRAFDPNLRREVAIKMLIDSLARPAGTEELERFSREARVTARLRHPGIVSVHEVGQHQGRPFIVMDYVDGEPLDRVVGRDRPEPRRVAQLVIEIAQALQHAHAEGVVHRDIKPQNVLVDATGKARLTDFGLARDEATHHHITMTGEALGTPSFMSPEQADARHEDVGPHSDVWALGALLYHALTREVPFTGSTAIAVLNAVLNAEPTPPRQLDPGLPVDLETIALRCLEKEPEHRYGSAKVVAEELERYLRGEPILARPISTAHRVKRWARRNRGLSSAVVGAAVLALLVGVLSIGLVRERGRNDTGVQRLIATARADVDTSLAEVLASRGDAAIAAGRQAVTSAAVLAKVTAQTEDRALIREARQAQLAAQSAFAGALVNGERWGEAEAALSSAIELSDVAPGEAARLTERLHAVQRKIAAEAKARALVEELLRKSEEGTISSAAAIEQLGAAEPDVIGTVLETLSGELLAFADTKEEELPALGAVYGGPPAATPPARRPTESALHRAERGVVDAIEREPSNRDFNQGSRGPLTADDETPEARRLREGLENLEKRGDKGRWARANGATDATADESAGAAAAHDGSGDDGADDGAGGGRGLGGASRGGGSGGAAPGAGGKHTARRDSTIREGAEASGTPKTASETERKERKPGATTGESEGEGEADDERERGHDRDGSNRGDETDRPGAPSDGEAAPVTPGDRPLGDEDPAEPKAPRPPEAEPDAAPAEPAEDPATGSGPAKQPGADQQRVGNRREIVLAALARLCDAVSKLERVPPRAETPLVRYLGVETDADRAALAARTLERLDTPAARDAVAKARARFGEGSAFAKALDDASR